MAKHVIAHNVVFIDDGKGNMKTCLKGEEVELSSAQAEKLGKLGALETKDEKADEKPATSRRGSKAQADSAQVEDDKAESEKAS